MIPLPVALKLGRVSNLPTVWTNMLAAIILAGGAVADARVLPIILALSLFYIGGMFLNDAFDADIDARERPERPIPSGQVTRQAVFTWGFGMLGAGIILLGVAGMGFAGGTGIWPAIGGVGLALAIIAYNVNHKGNPFSPVIMGICRVLVYVTGGLCFALALGAPLLTGAALLLAYLIGLTYVAKQENLGRVENMWPLLFLAAPVAYGAYLAFNTPVVWLFWAVFTGWAAFALYLVIRRQKGDIPKAVVSLIAGISLLDAMLIAGTGAVEIAGVATLGFLLTLFLQRYISGT